MNILKLFNFFRKKTEYEKEEEFEKNIILHNISENKNAVTAKVIQYIINEDSDIPDILHICDFHSLVFPQENSIIWAMSSDNSQLLPYKVIRYDYIEDPNTDINVYVYIVVKPAFMKEIAGPSSW